MGSPVRMVRAAARWLLVRRAVDVTAAVAGRRLLVISPHPDDETIGCGARIHLARGAGRAVTVVVVADGSGSHGDVDRDALRARRRAEHALAMTRLGVPADAVRYLDYRDGTLAQHRDAITADLARIIAAAAPDDVCVTSAGEGEPDHAAVGAATAAALRQLDASAGSADSSVAGSGGSAAGSGGSGGSVAGFGGSGSAGGSGGSGGDSGRRPPRLLGYPVWLWTDWPVSRRVPAARGLRQLAGVLRRRSVQTVSVAGVRTAKYAALAAHASQLGDQPLPWATSDYAPPAGSVALPRALISRALDGPELYFVGDIAGGVGDIAGDAGARRA